MARSKVRRGLETSSIKASRPNGQAEKLMKVAIELFSQRDFASITIKDIACAADVNSALIYYYFKSKEDLFREMIANAILQALENYGKLKARHSDPVDMIDDWFDNNVQMSALIRQLVKIMLDYYHGSTRIASVDTLIRRFYKEETGIVAAGIRHGIAKGIFQHVDADRMARFVSIHLDGIMVAAMIRPNFDIPSAIADLRQIFWHRLSKPTRRVA
jgi:AcrR family transcriptional regulator